MQAPTTFPLPQLRPDEILLFVGGAYARPWTWSPTYDTAAAQVDTVQARPIIASQWAALALPPLNRAGQQIVQAIARLESGYGSGWKPPMDSSRNWGAVQCRKTGSDCSTEYQGAECVLYSDTLDGTEATRYSQCFRVYPSHEEGCKDFLRELVIKRPAVLPTLNTGNALHVAETMRRNKYFGAPANTYAQAIVNNAREVARRLGEPLEVRHEDPAEQGPILGHLDRRDAALRLVSSFVPSDMGDPAFSEIARDYTEGKGTTCGFLPHWLWYRLGCRDRDLVNRSSAATFYDPGKNISKIAGSTLFEQFTGRAPRPGDVYRISNGDPDTEHVGVVLDVAGDLWICADAGQRNDSNRQAARVTQRRLTPDGLLERLDGASAPRRLQGWIDLDRVPLSSPANVAAPGAPPQLYTTLPPSAPTEPSADDAGDQGDGLPLLSLAGLAISFGRKLL